MRYILIILIVFCLNAESQVPISSLPAALSINSSDLFLITQSAHSRKLTFSILKNGIVQDTMRFDSVYIDNFGWVSNYTLGLKANKAILINSGWGLLGGGNLSANRTLRIDTLYVPSLHALSDSIYILNSTLINKKDSTGLSGYSTIKGVIDSIETRSLSPSVVHDSLNNAYKIIANDSIRSNKGIRSGGYYDLSGKEISINSLYAKSGLRKDGDTIKLTDDGQHISDAFDFITEKYISVGSSNNAFETKKSVLILDTNQCVLNINDGIANGAINIDNNSSARKIELYSGRSGYKGTTLNIDSLGIGVDKSPTEKLDVDGNVKGDTAKFNYIQGSALNTYANSGLRKDGDTIKLDNNYTTFNSDATITTNGNIYMSSSKQIDFDAYDSKHTNSLMAYNTPTSKFIKLHTSSGASGAIKSYTVLGDTTGFYLLKYGQSKNDSLKIAKTQSIKDSLMNFHFTIKTTKNIEGDTSKFKYSILNRGNDLSSYQQFLAGTTTGITQTDGLKIGIRGNGIAVFNQQENHGIEFWTNNTYRGIIDSLGNLGLGVLTVPKHKLSIVSSASTNNYAFNFVNSDFNKNRTSVSQSTDTSSINGGFTSTGKPYINVKNNIGTTVMNLDTTGDFTYLLSHGRMYFDGTYTPNVTVNVPYKLTPGMTVLESDYLTMQGDTVIFTRGGDYYVQFGTIFEGANNDEQQMSIWKNNVEQPSKPAMTTSGAGIRRGINWSWYLAAVSVNDRFCIKVTNLSSNNDPTFYNIYIYVRKETE